LPVDLARIAEESARGGFSLIAGTAASTVIGAVGVILIARLLGPASYGRCSLALVLPALFVSIADFGVSPALTRYAASLRSQAKYGTLASMIGSGLLFKLIVGLVAFLLVFVFSAELASSALQRQDMGQLVRLASLTILFQGVFSVSYNTSVGLDRMEQSALITVLRDIARVVLSPALIAVGFGVAGAILGQVAGWILAGLTGVWFLLGHRRTLRNMPSEIEPENGVRGDIQTMISFGLPLYAGSLLTTMLPQYQNIILAFFTSNAEIGNLNAAVNFGALIGIILTPVSTALFPAFSKLDLETGKDDLERMFKLSVRYTTLLILPVAIAIAALSKDLTRVVYGAAYSFAPTYLTLYACIFLLTGLGYQVVGSFFSGVGRTKETLKIAVVQLAIFLAVAPVMAWLYRVPGLIVALVVSALVATVFGLRLAAAKYGMRVDLKGSAVALAVALASSLPILPLVYYSLLPSLANVLIGASIYLATYLTLAPLLGAVRKTDLQILGPILGQIKILRPATNLILAYETRVLTALNDR